MPGTPDSDVEIWVDGAPVSATNPVPTSPSASAAKQPVTIADGDDAALGAVADAAVDTDANGTLSAKIRGLVKTTGATTDAAVDTDANGSISAKLRGLVKSLGATTAAKVDTDADGSVSAKLRGIVSRLATLVTSGFEYFRYTAPVTGEFAPGTTAGGVAFPTITSKMVNLVARSANTGKVYVGVAGATVTKADGTTDTATGYELIPGAATGWIPVDNLNRFKGIGDNATDSVTYMVLV